jgi:cephalosporin-C deacetylase-like acetyl esterase
MIIFALLCLVIERIPGMEVNLNMAYGPDRSPPRSKEMVFYSPMSSEFIFDKGDSVEIICQPIKRGISLDWKISHNRVEEPFLTGNVKPRFDNSFSIVLPTPELHPGFYDLRVTVHYTEDLKDEAITTFGWKPMEMKLAVVKPDDFDAFWAKAKASMEEIDLDLKVEKWKTFKGEEIDKYNVEEACLPESYDPEGEKYSEVEVYKVNFAGGVPGKRVYAFFAKPVGEGPFPGLLVLPGAGNNPRPAPVEHARHGYAAMDIQVHGNRADLPKEEYGPVPKEDLDSLELTADEMVHYGIYLNSLQAVNALAKLPGVDGERLAVCGGSQGGRLSVIVPALDERIKAAVPAIAHFAYIPWLEWTQRMNKEDSAGEGGFTADKIIPTPSLLKQSYFDILNFAPKIRCPVLMNAGLIDPVSPPMGIFAVYKQIQTAKQIVPLPNMAHDWAPAFDTYAWRWLDETLGVEDDKKDQ